MIPRPFYLHRSHQIAPRDNCFVVNIERKNGGNGNGEEKVEGVKSKRRSQMERNRTRGSEEMATERSE